MKRWIAAGLVLVLGATVVAAYLTWRRDEHYRMLIADGDRAADVDDTFGAIEAFSGAIALRPGSMLAWLKRGEIYLRRGDHRSALRDLRRAVSLDPTAPRSLELLGDTYLALERYARAVSEYEHYLALDDRDPRVLYKLGLARLNEGRPDAAVAALNRAIRLDDRSPEPHYLLGVCFGLQRRGGEAIRALERAVALAPAMVAAREVLADRYGEAGRTQDEVRQLEALTALDPTRAGRHVAVADAWARIGRFDLAVTTLVRATERFPDEPDLLVALGRVWLRVAGAGDDHVALSKALEALRRAVAQSPSGAALALFGRAQLLAGDHVGAIRSLLVATSSLPVDPRALADLAHAAERLGRFTLARNALVQEAALLGDAAPARDRADRASRIAALALRLGERAQALAWLARAQTAMPDDRTIAARIDRLKRQ
jgi:tetratricopeptide (TPR) repeat protein